MPSGEPVDRRPADRGIETPDGRRSTSAPPVAATTGPPSSAKPTNPATTVSRCQEPFPRQATARFLTPLGTAEARFLVPNQDIELDRPAAEPSLMAQLAEMTATAGGKALAPEELPTLLATARRPAAEAQEEVVAKTTYWDTWPFFLAFVRSWARSGTCGSAGDSCRCTGRRFLRDPPLRPN